MSESSISLIVAVALVVPILVLISTRRFRAFGVFGSSIELTSGALILTEALRHFDRYSALQLLSASLWSALLIGLGGFGLWRAVAVRSR